MAMAAVSLRAGSPQVRPGGTGGGAWMTRRDRRVSCTAGGPLGRDQPGQLG